MNKQTGKIALRLSQCMPERVSQMEPLIDRGIERKIDQLITGKYMRLGDKACADSLMHHGIK